MHAESSVVTPRLAATVMLVRADAAEGVAVYMTRRSTRSPFVPDAYVFPGGAVDPEDREIAARGDLHGSAGVVAPEIAAAAIRELFEEAGILFVRERAGGAAVTGAALLAELRRERVAGARFDELLARHGLVPDASALLYYSNWITPVTEPRRFDTHFFVARAPVDQIAAADAVEVHDGTWIAPAEAMTRADRGEMTIIFPTYRHLERLSRFNDVDALLAHARARSIAAVMPIERPDGTFAFAVDDDSW
ncbi:MAG: NUDIX domain-containing protein [Candidatus Eremiobacteraeota bacterium]|nr:NUDIX domain-containing protein [Candidatus Eremiobacteraeota bacterium]